MREKKEEISAPSLVGTGSGSIVDDNISINVEICLAW